MYRQTSCQYQTLLLSTVVIFLLIIVAIQHEEISNKQKLPISTKSSNSSVVISAPLATHSSEAPGFPKKLWYKVGPQGVSDEAKRFRHHCLDINPGFEYEVLTDAFADEYLWKWFSHRPDILNTYFSLSIPILKADLLRYLILYAYGGVWFDLDVSCEDIPIDDWVLEEHRTANLVVGLEFDYDYQEDTAMYSQFASWTIMAKPRSPHLMQVINDILDELNEIARRNEVSIEGIELSMISDVVDITGPKRMTWGIIKSLKEILGRELDDRDVGELRSARLIHDVLILPGNAFAGTQNGFKKGKGKVFVNHHYAGTWKNKFGGEAEKGSEKEKEIEEERRIEQEMEERRIKEERIGQERIDQEQKDTEEQETEQKNENEQDKAAAEEKEEKETKQQAESEQEDKIEEKNDAEDAEDNEAKEKEESEPEKENL
ncbi:putative initiation-specific alpha mannosyltransferase protein [Botrytis fragariae]|uniref:Putative initiation-specific alpha mannosyltransferase protein n=1 Tax=Botrytis fragariae TaxID=1964551 RepID=A0A8H6EM55_9HELO|nr:putative initiation-specific alpha mannosyltransferase protein [Botrytis fragariae]KAF5877214.1 putative initiation-specific alpha mannosyltransferase protein [Botrytis fragariae]